MKKIIKTTVAVFWLAISCAVLAAAPAGAPTDKDPDAYKGLSPDDQARLKKGEVVIVKELGKDDTSNTQGYVKAAMIVNQPLQKVYDLMAQDARQAEFVPYLDKVTQVQTYPDGDNIEERLRIIIMMTFRVRWHHDPQKYRLHWELDPAFKNDLKRLEGFWQFYYVDDTHTLCRYGTITEIGFGIPKSILKFLIQRDIPAALGNQKQWIESNGAWRKPGYKPN